jgi:hypothetical protein
MELEKMKTTITITDKEFKVCGDYNGLFAAEAHNLGGKWQVPEWVFDIRNEDLVRKTCILYYGTDGFTTDLVDVLTEGDSGFPARAPIEIFGRNVALAFGRDSGAKFGDGIVLETGKFSSSGSVKNWYTSAEDGTTVIMRDVSRPLVALHNNESIIVEVIGAASDVDKNALLAEKQKLLARLEEIETLLS